jgi:hypothetical protein
MDTPSSTSGAGAGLTSAQRETLQAVVGMLVPASPDGRMPGAADLPEVLRQVEQVAAGLPAVRDGLATLQTDAIARYGSGFAALDHASRSTLLDEFAARHPAVLQRLGLEAVTCYYQQDDVVERLGLEARPPYPLGYQVLAGDLTLLKPVIARGKIYRDAS